MNTTSEIVPTHHDFLLGFVSSRWEGRKKLQLLPYTQLLSFRCPHSMFDLKVGQTLTSFLTFIYILQKPCLLHTMHSNYTQKATEIRHISLCLRFKFGVGSYDFFFQVEECRADKNWAHSYHSIASSSLFPTSSLALKTLFFSETKNSFQKKKLPYFYATVQCRR